MNFYIEEENKKRFEKQILFIIESVLVGLINNKIDILDGEHIIFSPRNYSELQKQHINKDITDLILKGCELEDIKSLLPDQLMKEINHLLQTTQRLLKDNY